MQKMGHIGAAIVIVGMLGLAAATPPAAASDLTIPGGGRISVELITSDASFSNTLSVISPAVGIAATGCSLEAAVGLGGVHVLSEKVSQRGCRADLDADPTTAGVQGFPANTVFEFGMCAQTDADAACEFVWSSNPANNSDTFDHVQTTTLAPGVFQLAWEDLENGGDMDFNDLIVVVRVQADNDGDGLWDDWETSGVDTDADGVVDVDLPALGADPDRKDIFLELDYMDCAEAGGDCVAGDTHSHEPKMAAVDAVVDAFADAPVPNPDGSMGITLHVDIDDAIPHQNFLSLGCGFGSSFDAVKADPAFFGPANPLRFTHHYGIFAHRQDATTSSSGCGELPGNDMIVTLGEWNTICVAWGPDTTLDTAPAGDDVTDGTFIFTGPDLVCDTTASNDDLQFIANGSSPNSDPDGDTLEDRTVGTVQQQAGTLMHEFGHNLQLCHGGEYDPPSFTNCNENNKPNYLSVMNYTFQIPGIGPTDPDGAGPLTARVDYSPDDLPDLNENDLDETAGIGDGTDNTVFVCPTGGANTGPGTGAIDWNCDGDGGADASVSVDISGGGGLVVLTGWDDWANLKYDFQTASDFEDGVHNSTDSIEEIDLPTAVERLLGVRIDIRPFSDPNPLNTKSRGVVPVAICNGDGVENAVTITDPGDPDGFSGASTNVFVQSVRFADGSDGAAAHDLTNPAVLGDHMTRFVDTDADGRPDTLVPLDAPNCAGGPAGPDLVVHVPIRDTGIVAGQTEACLTAQLTSGPRLIGCDAVLVRK